MTALGFIPTHQADEWAFVTVFLTMSPTRACMLKYFVLLGS